MEQQMSFEFSQSPFRQRAKRREPREELVRLVECTPFPRKRANERRRLAFTRDLSLSGLQVAGDYAFEEGSLLHVVLHSAQGKPIVDGLARVVWSRPEGEERHRTGLFLIAKVDRGQVRTRLSANAA